MTTRRSILTVIASFALPPASCTRQQATLPATLIIRNARSGPSTSGCPRRARAVTGETIARVGSDAEVEALVTIVGVVYERSK